MHALYGDDINAWPPAGVYILFVHGCMNSYDQFMNSVVKFLSIFIISAYLAMHILASKTLRHVCCKNCDISEAFIKVIARECVRHHRSVLQLSYTNSSSHDSSIYS